VHLHLHHVHVELELTRGFLEHMDRIAVDVHFHVVEINLKFS